MDEKIKKPLIFLGLGYMLFFCFAMIPYLGALIGFEGDFLYIMALPLVAWWIFLLHYVLCRDLSYEAQYVNPKLAIHTAQTISIIFCIINLVAQLGVLLLSGIWTPLPLILSVGLRMPLATICAMIGVLAGSMVLAPMFMRKMMGADLHYYVKHTTTTYLDFGYSETTTSNRFILTGQFIKMGLWTAFLSLLVSATPAVIIVLIVRLCKRNKE